MSDAETTGRRTLSAESAAAVRAYAATHRERADRLAAALEDLARNGLPHAEDCTPWETVRDRRLAELATAATGADGSAPGRHR
ncbi:hypothetical protein ACGFX4_30525 [Kitasatospora sp. NPDC048365]|uniref:hypothetical protein n=1 Tax=Kitasatospora sp. NPDC048365 TaxID=3364050 RepID=UPI003718C0D0